MAVQSLGSIRELALEWQEPVKTLIDFTKVFAFDLHIIRITCLYGTDTPALHFTSQLLACPAACGVSRRRGNRHIFSLFVRKQDGSFLCAMDARQLNLGFSCAAGWCQSSVGVPSQWTPS